jgi:hypothetical protein
MNGIPIIGWLLSLIIHMSFALPFWIIWTRYELGAKFFSFLPEVYFNVGYWEIVGFFTCVSILKRLFTPKFTSMDYSSAYAKAKSEVKAK